MKYQMFIISLQVFILLSDEPLLEKLFLMLEDLEFQMFFRGEVGRGYDKLNIIYSN